MSDLIERQAAIDLINDIDLINFTAKGVIRGRLQKLPSAQPETKCIAKVTLTDEQVKEAVEKAKSEIVQVFPSEQPERKKGKWIQNNNGTYSCSLCHSWIPEEQYYYARFCLHCGAKMEVENEI